MLERRMLDCADPTLGKLRNFLLACVGNYLSDERDRAHAEKRGEDWSDDSELRRVARGGAWSTWGDVGLRWSARNVSDPAGADAARGFRCVLAEAPPRAAEK